MALFGLKLSEPISQIQVLQRGNTQKSANPLIFFNEGLAWPGSQGQGEPMGSRLRSWFLPLQFL